MLISFKPELQKKFYKPNEILSRDHSIFSLIPLCQASNTLQTLDIESWRCYEDGLKADIQKNQKLDYHEILEAKYHKEI